MADYRGWNSWLQRGDGVLSDLIGECMTWSAKRSDLRLSLTVKVIKATSGWQQVDYISWWQRESGEDIKTTSADCSSAMISFYDDMKWSYCWLDNIYRSKAAVIRWCHNSWGCRDLIIMMKWWSNQIENINQGKGFENNFRYFSCSRVHLISSSKCIAQH